MGSRRTWLLAIAIVVIELLSGLQVYVTATVVPLIADEFGGQHLYGVASATIQAAVFLSLPLSPWLIRRWSASVVLSVATAVGVVAAIAAALSPSMQFYIAARAVSGLTSGALAGVGMRIIAQELTGNARRFTLAANNVMWVASSIVGPTYAASLSALLSWRLALVAYLPLLVLARLVIIGQLRSDHRDRDQREPLPWHWAVLLAGGMALIGLLPPADLWGAVVTLTGLGIVGISMRTLLPRPVARLTSRGTPAAIQLLGWVTGAIFGIDAVISIIAHDVLAMSVGQIGGLLTAGGLAWALVGLVTAARPTGSRRFGPQATVALLAVAGGAAISMACLAHTWLGFSIGWVVMNLGVGLIYLDLLNLIFDERLSQPIDPGEAGTTVALIEATSAAVFGTVCANLVSLGPHAAAWPFVVAILACGLGTHALSRIRFRDAPATASQ